ncbi:hypothetical protein L0F63_002264, partial [Massospora cicadina]
MRSKRFVRRVLSPLIAVVASPELDELCVENSIPSFVDLIRPFGVEMEGNATIRDSKGQPNQHSDVTVRFVDLKKIEPATNCSDDPLLSRNLSDLIKHQARSTDHLKAEVLNGIEQAYRRAEILPEGGVPAPAKGIDRFKPLLAKDLDELTPWFTLYRSAFFNRLRLAEHETFDHPVACIVATSTGDPQPQETLAQLYRHNDRSDQLPYFDPDLFQYYVLVHDARRGDIDSAMVQFEAVKKTLGVHCQLLVINSRPPKSEGQAKSIVPDVWGYEKDETQVGRFERRGFLGVGGEEGGSRAPGECGTQLSLEDFEGLKKLIRKMFVESVLPHMERCVHLWNERAASSRRGFTGRLFSASKRYFSGRSQLMPGGGVSASPLGAGWPSPAAASSNVYPYTTPEAQLRKLADYAFMLRDYDFARSTYEDVKKDFQADGAWRFYAGAQEMTGLCLLFSEGSGSRIDVERYYDKAVRRYQSDRMGTWAVRSVLLYHAMLRHHGRYADIPPLLARLTSEESDLRSALLLEQAAHGFLRASRVRKFGFHLILAGHRYNKCNQREHAYYCYQLAAKVFGVDAEDPAQDAWRVARPDKRWGLMEDHICFSLGRQSFHLGELRQAVAHFTRLLHDSQQPAAVQAGYMKEFLYIYKHYIASTGHEILLEPSRSLPVPVLTSVGLQVSGASTAWEDDAALPEEDDPAWVRLSEGIPIPPNGIVSRAEPKLHICPLQETFNVLVQVYNPLAIPLTLSAMALDYVYEGGGSIHHVPAADRVLEPHQSATLTFVVAPQNEGILKLNGLTLVINELARTYKSFARRGPRLNDTLKQRQSCVYGPSYHCTVRVVAALPKLSLQLDGLPERIFSGELVAGRLQLRNVGASALARLCVSLSHPTFLAFGCHTPCPRAQGTVTIDNNIHKCANAAIEFYSELCHDEAPLTSLDSGQVGQVPVHLRGDRVGVHKLYLLFRYETDSASDGGSQVLWRAAKLVFKVEVVPSLKINAYTRPSLKALGQFVIGIEVENVQSAGTFQITQLSSLSHRWRITPISRCAAGLSLPPGSSTSLYFSVTAFPCSTDSIDWESTEAHLVAALQNLARGSKLITEFPPLALTYTDLPMGDEAYPHGIFDYPCWQLYLASRTQNRTNWLSRDLPALDPSTVEATFPLLHPSDIDLALFWEVGKARGLHYIIGITFALAQNPLLDHLPNPPSALYQVDPQLIRPSFEGSAQKVAIRHLMSYPRFTNESPVRAILQTPDSVQLSFEGGWAEIPVTFLLENFSWNRSADITLTLLPTHPSDATTHAAAEVCRTNVSFWWAGPSHHTLQSLKPGAQHQFHTKVIFVRPGTYDLSLWQLDVVSHTVHPDCT